VGDIDVDSNALETLTLEGNGKTWVGNASVGNVNASTEMTFSDFDADGYLLDVYVNEESSAVNVAVNLTDVDNVDLELVLDDSADGTAPDDVVTFTLDGVKNSNNNTYIYTSDAETLNVVVAGDSAVEAIGDYCAGPNHVLPTMRQRPFLFPPGRLRFPEAHEPRRRHRAPARKSSPPSLPRSPKAKGSWRTRVRRRCAFCLDGVRTDEEGSMELSAVLTRAGRGLCGIQPRNRHDDAGRNHRRGFGQLA